MRAVVQRVSRAQVSVGQEIVGKIGHGLLVLLGIAKADTQADADYLAAKILGLRIFEDEGGKMNLSVADTQGGVLAVSQFTLYGDVRKGKRPSFDDAASPGDFRGRAHAAPGRRGARGDRVARAPGDEVRPEDARRSAPRTTSTSGSAVRC